MYNNPRNLKNKLKHKKTNQISIKVDCIISTTHFLKIYPTLLMWNQRKVVKWYMIFAWDLFPS